MPSVIPHRTDSPARAATTGRTLAFVACALVLSGCKGAAPPRFEVESVSLTEQTPSGYVLTFTLQGENSNDEALPLRDVHYTLSLDGRTVFSGHRSAQATLPRNGTQRITLPIAIATRPGEPQWFDEARYQLNGSVVYLLPGSIAELLFDSGLRRPSVAFGRSGVLDYSTIDDRGSVSVPQ